MNITSCTSPPTAKSASSSALWLTTNGVSAACAASKPSSGIPAYNTFIVKNIDVTETCTSGDAFATDSSIFERLQRAVNSCERVYHRTLKELEVARARGLRTEKPDAGPQPEESKPTSTPSASFRQNPQTPPSASPKPADTPPPATDAPENPAETQPSAENRDPKPPQTA
jgi:hypothetical protein